VSTNPCWVTDRGTAVAGPADADADATARGVADAPGVADELDGAGAIASELPTVGDGDAAPDVDAPGAPQAASMAANSIGRTDLDMGAP
jgi:hypothetical protein